MNRIGLLDYGRFVASISVLFFHYFYNGIRNGKITSIGFFEDLSGIAQYCHIGVNFFFIISGYVIFYSVTNKTSADFVLSRLKRLYPSYWFGILFTSVVILLWGQQTQMQITLKQVLVNFTMFQSFFGVNNVDGVYWTLAYELIFYLIVSLVLLVFDQKKLSVFFKIWPFIIAGCYLMGYYQSLFYAFFSFGVLIAMYKTQKDYTVLVPLAVSAAMCYYKMAYIPESVTDSLIYGTIMSLFILFFIALNNDKVRAANLPKSRLLGALTYPLYLVHAHFGYLLISRYATESNKYFVYALVISLVFLITYGIHFFIEKKMKPVWDVFFRKMVYPYSLLEQLVMNLKRSVSERKIFAFSFLSRNSSELLD